MFQVLLAVVFSLGAHAENSWTVRCDPAQPAVSVHLENDYTQSYSCVEGTGNYAHQYLAAFSADSTLYVGASSYQISAGENLGLEYAFSCDALDQAMHSDRPDIAFNATDALTGVQVRFERLHMTNQVTLYTIVDGNLVVSCRGVSSR